jgi:hypothetical protein
MALVGTVITCISDDEGFDMQVYQYLCERLEKQTQFKEGKNIVIRPDLVRLDAENKTIHVDENARAPSGMIKWILESYLKSNPSKFKDYGVVEIGDTFTIGRILHPSKMEMSACEICGYFTPHQEALYTHRMTHFGI